VDLAANTSYTLSLASVCNVSGQVQTGPVLSLTTGLAIDITRPTVLSITPAHQSIDVPVTTSITVVFSELLDPVGFRDKIALNRIRVYTGSSNFAGDWTVSGATAVFTPLNPLPGLTRININLNDVDDQVGNDSANLNFFFDTEIL